MGHFLQAFVGRETELSECLSGTNAAKIVLLRKGWAIVPLTSTLREFVHSQNPEEASLLRPTFGSLTNAIGGWAERVFANHAVAYIETEYHGGVGSQRALVWKGGCIVVGPVEHDDERTQLPRRRRLFVGSRPDLTQLPINSALRFLGVTADDAKDEFDTIQLGTFRETDSVAQQHQ